MKKLAILTRDINGTGGVETMVRSLYYQLTDLGYSVDLLSICSAETTYSTSIPVKHLGFSIPKYRVKRILLRPKLSKQISAHLNEYDYVLGNSTYRYLLLPRRNASYKQLELFHTDFDERLVAKNNLLDKIRIHLTLWYRNRLYKRLDQLIVLTKRNKIRFEKAGITRCIVIPNGIGSPSAFVDTQRTPKKLLFVGRLDLLKGLTYLLDAWVILSKKHSEISLNLYGSGDAQAYITDRIRDEQLERITLNPPTDTTEQVMAQHDIFLFPSLWEGFPLVLLEALNVGLPPVAFDCHTGPGEIVRNGKDGFIVPVGDTEQFVKKVELLLMDKQLWQDFSTRGRVNIKRYHWDTISRLWATMLQSID